MKAMLVFLIVCVALAAAAPSALWGAGLWGVPHWGAHLVGPVGPVAPSTAVIGPTVVNAAPHWGAHLVGPVGPVAPKTAVIGPTVVNAAPGVWPASHVVHPGVVATSWW